MKINFIRILVLFLFTIASLDACYRLYQGKEDGYESTICEQKATLLQSGDNRVAQGCNNYEECETITSGNIIEVPFLPPKPSKPSECIDGDYIVQKFDFCSPQCNDNTEYLSQDGKECKTIPTCDIDEYLDESTYECKLIPLAQEKRDAVDRHNEIRVDHYADGEIYWDTTIEQSAQDCVNGIADSGIIEHCKNDYGENLYASTRDDSYIVAIDYWNSEEQYYNYDTNECDSGKVCGHYTQIVWKNSTELGCAKAQILTGDYKNWFVISCQYNPPGNYVGQKPY